MRDIAAVRTQEDYDRALDRWSFDFELYGPFPGSLDSAAHWYLDNASTHRGYAYLTQKEIADQINALPARAQTTQKFT